MGGAGRLPQRDDLAKALLDRGEFYDWGRESAKATTAPATDEAEGGFVELSNRLGLDKPRQVVNVEMFGRGTSAVAVIDLANGKKITFDTVGHHATPTKLMVELALQVGTTPTIKGPDVVRILKLLHDLGRIHAEHERDEQARDHAFTYLRASPVEAARMDDQGDRWRAFSILDALDPVSAARLDGTSVAHRSLVIEDTETGLRFVRVTWFKAYVRQQAGPGDAEAISRAVQQLGWRKPGTEGRIKATGPGPNRTLQWTFFVVPKGWEAT